MKAVKKLRWKIAGAFIAAACFALVWQCTNPNKPPLRWQSVYDVPLTNDSFFLAQQMTNIFNQFNGDSITVLGSGRSPKDTGVYYDTTNPRVLLPDTGQFRKLKYGDTAVFSLLQNDSISYDVDVPQGSMATQNYYPILGFVQISNAATFTVTIPLPAGPFNIPSTSFSLSSEIDTVIFSDSSSAMLLTVANNSGATITNLNISLPTFNYDSVVSSLGPNSSIILSIPVGGHGIFGGVVPINIQGSAGVAGSVSFSFNPNGLLMTHARIMDSLVVFSKTDTNDYNLTDTLNVGYIDILSGFFPYAFHNYTHIPLQVQITQLNLWQTTPYCVKNNLISVANLDTMNARGIPLDSLYYFGRLTSDQVIDVGGSVTDSLKSNFNGMRLFPVWNPNIRQHPGDSGESVARFFYTIKNGDPHGGMVTISFGDSMLFTVSSPTLKFDEMAGTVVLPYVRNGDTAKVAVPFPWNASSKDSLRNRFVLDKVWADIFMKPNLPDSVDASHPRAIFDTLGITYSIFNPLNTSIMVDSSKTLHYVVNDSIFRLSPTDITSIINQFPDSMYIAIGVKVPAGTYLRTVNELTNPNDPNYPLYIGQMFIKSNVTARMNAVLTWHVNDTASLDLGTGRFKVPKATRYITKMDGLTATMHMNTLNKTNVYMNLYALMAPKANSLMDTLDSLHLDVLWTYIADSAKAHKAGFVNLLGPNGVRIPARDSTQVDSVILNDWQINSILQSDSASWRWEARFMPMGSDALADTDFIKLKSWMHIVGNNNMDSLLIWH